MEATYNTKAIILTRQPFREHDSRVAAYSPDFGKIDLVVRGARKIGSKLAGHLEPISLVRIMVVRGKRYDYIGGVAGEESFAAIKSDLNRIFHAGRIIAAFNALIRGSEKDEMIFDLLLEYLFALNNIGAAPDCGPLDDFFTVKLLAAMGYRPELSACVVCRREIGTESGHFNFADGGVMCAKCAGVRTGGATAGKALSARSIIALKTSFHNALAAAGSASMDIDTRKEISYIVNSFRDYHFG